MTSNYTHLTEAAAAATELAIPERVELMYKDRFIRHERLAPIFRSVDYLVKRPRSARASGLVVSGAAGAGKTALSEALVRRYPSSDANDRRPASQPVLLTCMTGAHETKEIYTRMLSALGCQEHGNRTLRAKKDMAFKLIDSSAVRLLIFDEIQDVLLATPRQQILCLEAIKEVMNYTRLPVVALGTEEAAHTMERDPHLNARFRHRSLPVWKCDEYLANFLMSLETVLPLKKPSRLSSLGVMRALVKTSDGCLNELVSIVQTAGALAIEDGTERITLAHIEQATEEVPESLVLEDVKGVKAA